MKLFKGSLTILASNWIMFPLGLLQSFLVIDYLGANGRGNFVLFQSIYTIGAFVLTSGMPTSAVYFFRQKIYSLATIALSFCLFSILVMFIASPLIYFNFGHISRVSGLTEGSPTLALFCVIALGSLFYSNFSQSLLLSLGYAKLVSLINLGRAAFCIIIIYVLCGLFNYDLPTLIIGIVTLDLVVAMLATLIIVKMPYFGVVANLRKCLKDMVSYGLKSYLNPILPLVQNNVSNIFIGRMNGPDAVAYFSLAVSIYNGINKIPKAVNSLLLGVVSDSGYENPNMKVAKVTSSLTYTMGALAFLLGVSGYFLIPSIFGMDFTQVLIPLYILLVTVVIVSAGATLQTSFFASYRPQTASILSMVGAGSLLILTPIGISYFDIIGAAIAIFFVRLTVYGLTVSKFKRISGVRWSETIKPDKEALHGIIKRAKKYIKKS
ncbi:MAG: lipopolysaccharide biosynthesis protein [Gammaproteobacteria bacterium]